MSYRNLFVFAEGPTDADFFVSKVIVDQLLKINIHAVTPIKYASEKNWNAKLRNLINSINSINSKNPNNIALYIYARDFDSHTFPCITSARENIIKDHSVISKSNILIVKEEIESWYLAGIKKDLAKKYNITIPKNTDNISKEHFESLFSDEPLTALRTEILDNYSITQARKRNSSFNYFIKKLKKY